MSTTSPLQLLLVAYHILSLIVSYDLYPTIVIIIFHNFCLVNHFDSKMKGDKKLLTFLILKDDVLNDEVF